MVEIDNKKMWEAIEKLLDVADAIKVSLNKQGLQWNGKEIVSMEPKFKIGDWVVSKLDGKVRQISEVHCDEYNNYYIVEGDEYNIEEYDRLHHLWTIADAKPGDVIAANECYVIFKEIDGLNIRCYLTYHYLGFNPSFCVDTLQNKNAFYPATKEQRDTLFKAMKEAGYVWLSDKNKLVKLLFKEGDTVRKKLDGSIWHINYINEHGYWGNHKPLFPIENQNDFELVEPELTPSEVTKGKSELTEFERFLNEVDVLHKAYMAYPAIYQVNDGKESVKGHYDLNFEYRQAYLTGYHQAKKDCAEHLNK